MFNITSKKRTIIVTVIGLIFIFWGLIQALTGLKVAKNIQDIASYVLMAIALLVFVSGRRNNASSGEPSEKRLEDKSEEKTDDKNNGSI